MASQVHSGKGMEMFAQNQAMVPALLLLLAAAMPAEGASMHSLKSSRSSQNSSRADDPGPGQTLTNFAVGGAVGVAVGKITEPPKGKVESLKSKDNNRTN